MALSSSTGGKFLISSLMLERLDEVRDGSNHGDHGGERGAEVCNHADIVVGRARLVGDDNLTTGLHLTLRGFGDLTVLVEDEGLGALGTIAIATSLVDVPLVALTLAVGHGVGIHDVTIDLDRTRVFGHDETVALTEDDIVVATGIGQGFVEFDTDIVDVS